MKRRIRPNTMIAIELFAIELKPGRAVVSACCNPDKLLGGLVEAMVIWSIIAGVDRGSIRGPVKTDRITQAGSKWLQFCFGGGFIDNKYTTATIALGIGLIQPLIAAISRDTKTHIETIVRTQFQGAARMLPSCSSENSSGRYSSTVAP